MQKAAHTLHRLRFRRLLECRRPELDPLPATKVIALACVCICVCVCARVCEWRERGTERVMNTGRIAANSIKQNELRLDWKFGFEKKNQQRKWGSKTTLLEQHCTSKIPKFAEKLEIRIENGLKFR